jgi:hypothetical protein
MDKEPVLVYLAVEVPVLLHWVIILTSIFDRKKCKLAFMGYYSRILQTFQVDICICVEHTIYFGWHLVVAATV